MNQIIIELCAEDRARLDKIAGLLEAQIEATLRAPVAHLDATMEKTAETPQKTTEAESQGNTQPEPETQAQPQAVEPESVETGEHNPVEGKKDETHPLTVEDIRRLVVTLSANGKKDEARKVVQTYAKTVSDLPADKYAEVWAQLKALEV